MLTRSLFLVAAALTPLAVAAAPFAYVAISTDHAVAVIDTATNTVVTTIQLGPSQLPIGVAMSPDGAFAYVATLYNVNSLDVGAVLVIATITNTVVATVPVRFGPTFLAVTPNGAFVYVFNAGEDTVSVIATATNTVVATISVGPHLGTRPSGIAITPDGAFAYVTNSITNSVVIIDTTTNSVVATIPVDEGPNSVAITPDGAFAYVVTLRGNVWVIDTATKTAVAKIPVGPCDGVSISPDGALAYVACLLYVSVIDTATKTDFRVNVPFNTLEVAFRPDGKFAYVTADFLGNNVLVFDTSTSTVVATIPLGNFPYGIAIQNCVDTDGDGLCDDWEKNGLTINVNGTPVFLDLPAMGADPNHKDVFVQLDTVGLNAVVPQISLDAAIKAFAKAPLSNPDGTTGITLHVDNGPDSIMDPRTGATWGTLSKKSFLDVANLGNLGPGGGCDAFPNLFDVEKKLHFPPERVPVFHYAISELGPLLGADGKTPAADGIARCIPSSDLIVSSDRAVMMPT